MKTKHNYVIIAIACVCLLACVALLGYLPDTIPVHWNANGEIDGYGSKYMILGLGALPIGIYFLMNVTRKLDPKYKKIEEKIDVYNLMRDLMTLLFVGINILFVYGMMNPTLNMTTMVSMLIGSAFIVMGNYMPRVPHNYFLGCKTPWAIADETNWKKTQRMGGYVLCLGGILMLITSIFNKQFLMVASMCVLIVGVILVYIYSWLLFKKGQEDD